MDEMPEQLANVPDIPESLKYLWAYFLKLSNRRGNNGFGLTPISPETLTAWKTLNQIKLQPWEVDLIFELDDIFIEVSSKDLKKGSD